MNAARNLSEGMRRDNCRSRGWHVLGARLSPTLAMVHPLAAPALENRRRMRINRLSQASR